MPYGAHIVPKPPYDSRLPIGILRDAALAGNDSLPLVAPQSKKGVFAALSALRCGISLTESGAMSPGAKA